MKGAEEGQEAGNKRRWIIGEGDRGTRTKRGGRFSLGSLGRSRSGVARWVGVWPEWVAVSFNFTPSPPMHRQHGACWTERTCTAMLA